MMCCRLIGEGEISYNAYMSCLGGGPLSVLVAGHSAPEYRQHCLDSQHFYDHYLLRTV
jgi:hypothetical protein